MVPALRAVVGVRKSLRLRRTVPRHPIYPNFRYGGPHTPISGVHGEAS